MLPKKIKTILTQQIPAYLIKEREQSKNKKLSYISGSTVMGLLNHAFDWDWDWEVTEQWIEQSEAKVNKYKANEVEAQPPVAHAKGLLTVRFTDDAGIYRTIRKTGHGSKVIVGGASEQDSIYKAASTDALKKAASMLGIGMQLYRDANEASYFAELEYVNPWTSEMKEAYKTQLTTIENFKKGFQNGDDVLRQYVYSFTKQATSDPRAIEPNNIDAFIRFIDSINS